MNSPAKASEHRPRTLQLRDEDRDLLAKYVLAGSSHPELGFQEFEWSLNYMLKLLQDRNTSIRTNKLSTNLVECALWYSNMLDELGEWSHPEGLTFDQWVRNLLPKKLTYDKFWCLIEVI